MLQLRAQSLWAVILHPTLHVVFGSLYSDFSLSTVDKSDFFQAPAGLDVDVGGVNPALFQFVAASRFDSWFTVGADDGESQNALSCVGSASICVHAAHAARSVHPVLAACLLSYPSSVWTARLDSRSSAISAPSSLTTPQFLHRTRASFLPRSIRPSSLKDPTSRRC